MSSTTIGSLGVMVCRRSGFPPFAEKHYLQELSEVGERLGVSVFVFCPEEAPRYAVSLPSENPSAHIRGYRYASGQGWISCSFPIPGVIYDRCLYRSARESAAVAAFLGGLPKAGWRLWSRGLPGKLSVYNTLSRSPDVIDFLPPTLSYTGSKSLSRALATFHGEVFMKPSGGSQGRRTLYISLRDQGSVRLQGRDRSNDIFSRLIALPELPEWVSRFTAKRRFLMQPFLHLHSRSGNPFDVRALVQKNAKGLWSLTGVAVREGAGLGLTSNLHGGGTALLAQPYLAAEFGAETAASVLATIRRLSRLVPTLLESSFGRLGELGIDFGIDREGKVWLLEVNSKPGREAFKQTGEQPAATKAIENPLHYTRYLLLRQLRRVNT